MECSSSGKLPEVKEVFFLIPSGKDQCTHMIYESNNSILKVAQGERCNTRWCIGLICNSRTRNLKPFNETKYLQKKNYWKYQQCQIQFYWKKNPDICVDPAKKNQQLRFHCWISNSFSRYLIFEVQLQQRKFLQSVTQSSYYRSKGSLFFLLQWFGYLISFKD